MTTETADRNRDPLDHGDEAYGLRRELNGALRATAANSSWKVALN
jgi:hypothetical protein